MRRSILFLAIFALGGCSRHNSNEKVPRDSGGQVLESTSCMKKDEVVRLESKSVSDADARRLALHYGVCLSDAKGQERWLRILADRGDRNAMEELANLIRYQPARSAEAARWDALSRESSPPPQK
jgi:hypothetical protein